MLDDPNERLALLAGTLEDSIATVFRQVAMNRFEHAVHTARRDEGELSVERFNELWAEHADRDARRRRRDHRGLPLVVELHPALHAHAGLRVRLRVRPAARAERLPALRAEVGDEFVPRYLELLRAGGSMSRRSSARSSTATSPTRPSGTADWRSSTAARRRREEAAAAAGRG